MKTVQMKIAKTPKSFKERAKDEIAKAIKEVKKGAFLF